MPDGITPPSARMLHKIGWGWVSAECRTIPSDKLECLEDHDVELYPLFKINNCMHKYSIGLAVMFHYFLLMKFSVVLKVTMKRAA